MRSTTSPIHPYHCTLTGRIKTLTQSFRVVDEDTRRSIQKARLDALESDNHGDEGQGGIADDDEFYVDDDGVRI